MGKSGGDKMRAMGQGRSAGDERKSGKGEPEASESELAILERETERLKAELASERERVRNLEDVNGRVAKRLNAAIESVKAILGRQG
jgi:Domain of unknown function (DUF4164)